MIRELRIVRFQILQHIIQGGYVLVEDDYVVLLPYPACVDQPLHALLPRTVVSDGTVLLLIVQLAHDVPARFLVRDYQSVHLDGSKDTLGDELVQSDDALLAPQFALYVSGVQSVIGKGSGKANLEVHGVHAPGQNVPYLLSFGRVRLVHYHRAETFEERRTLMLQALPCGYRHLTEKRLLPYLKGAERVPRLLCNLVL